MQGEVAVTLEWIKVAGLNKDRSMPIRKKETSEYVLFNTKSNRGIAYTRWGAEAKWNIEETASPSMYLTVH